MNKYLIIIAVASFVWSCGKKESESQNNQSSEQQPAVQVINGESASQPLSSVAESANSQMVSTMTQPAQDGKAAILTFDETSHDFGKVKEGQKVKHVFKFKNTGDAPLMITKVSPACGCTAPQWTSDPVNPGATGSVTLEFDSQNRKGIQNKTATVESNTKGGQSIVLSFKVEVLGLPEEGPVK